MRFLTLWLLPLSMFALLPGLVGAQQTDELKSRRWRVIILVPEQHLARPRIPDPAVETALSRQLLEAGYKVIDNDRIRELRYSAVMDRIIAGGPDAAKEAIQAARKFGWANS